MADGAECGAVDVVHRVAACVPVCTEACGAVGGVVDDVEAGDAQAADDVDVVVDQVATGGVDEVASEAEVAGGRPDAVDVGCGVAVGGLLAVEDGVARADHVEQDAVFGRVARCVRVARPMLRAEAPGGLTLRVVRGGIEGRCTAILGVEEDDVYAHVRR